LPALDHAVFRKKAKEEIARLLEYWRQIERGIKRAEQISGKAVIPAINELRYASRQLYNAIRIFDKKRLTAGDISNINKRLIIAEQYLLNADHDVIDGSVSFYRKEIIRLNKEFGVAGITTHYHDYPHLRDVVNECDRLIEETRFEYSKRKQNYDEIRNNHLDTLVNSYRSFETAEIDALFERAKLERQIVIKKGTIRILDLFSTVGAIASIIGVPLAFWLALSTWGFHLGGNFYFGFYPDK
jgi:hypothetical protein